MANLSLRALFSELANRCTALAVATEPDVEANMFARAVRRSDLTATVR